MANRNTCTNPIVRNTLDISSIYKSKNKFTTSSPRWMMTTINPMAMTIPIDNALRLLFSCFLLTQLRNLHAKWFFLSCSLLFSPSLTLDRRNSFFLEFFSSFALLPQALNVYFLIIVIVDGTNSVIHCTMDC